MAARGADGEDDGEGEGHFERKVGYVGEVASGGRNRVVVIA